MISRTTLSGLLIAGVVALADQASKLWALNGWFDPPRTIEITPFFNLVAVWNTGVSFGFLAGRSDVMPFVLAGFATLVALVLVVWLFRAQGLLLTIGLGLVIGGAIGNIIDRLNHRAVVDFIDIHFAGFHWPAFNLADSAITVGVGLLLVDSFTRRDEPSDRDRKPETPREP